MKELAKAGEPVAQGLSDGGDTQVQAATKYDALLKERIHMGQIL